MSAFAFLDRFPFVARYWAVARDARRHPNPKNPRALTLSRWGWSNDSQEAAQAKAQGRLEAAFALAYSRWDAGEAPGMTGRQEQVREYGADDSADGYGPVPICEEIVSVREHGVITRNRYGALCLNTHQIAIADVDVQEHDPLWPSLVFGVLVMSGALWGAHALLWEMPACRDNWGPIVAACFLGSVVASTAFAAVLPGLYARLRLAGWMSSAWERIQTDVDRHLAGQPHVLYRTRQGFRILSLVERDWNGHLDWIAQVPHVDPLYLALCKRQRCTRVRLTAKPWRVGLLALEKTLSFWGNVQFDAHKRQMREHWVRDYDAACAQAREQGQAVARRARQEGSAPEGPVAELLAMHDAWCLVAPGQQPPKADTDLV